MRRIVPLALIAVVSFVLGYALAEARHGTRPVDPTCQDAEAVVLAHVSAIGTIASALRSADRPDIQRRVLENGLDHFSTMGSASLEHAPDLVLEYSPNLRLGVERALEYARQQDLDPDTVPSLEALLGVFTPGSDSG